MYCISVENPGPDNQVIMAESPTPAPSATQLLVKVHAAGVNRADLLQRRGIYPAPAGESTILGLELSGEIVDKGSEVYDFSQGELVYALVSGGAYAEYCLVEQNLAHKIPSNWSMIQAAAIPEALTTVYGALIDQGLLQTKQNFLIHGAGSGISTFAIQAAHAMRAEVYTSVGSDEKMVQAKLLYPHQCLNYQNSDFFSQISDSSMDVIIDFIGGDYLNYHLKWLKPKGRLVQIAAMKGAKADCDLGLIIKKRLHLIGFVLRTQSLAEKSRLWSLAHKLWFDDFCQGRITPIIDSVFPLKDVGLAHERMKQSQHFGKIIIDFRL